ncbi:hypothetical protein Y11_42921 [Yersinia enterocolitica subsp. palearctica Y11]|uniref:Uncharacterized protein n=1 Tax=Yersinia enterocolitica subsp. palearctica serotype O:3 (strain DSM 13030 / CIP 106945 / Y11) TaxID=930944 RepID=A0A0H3NSP9_YERE1|nr:hypothetical protein Y11_42921 [Yersinia enterocolitica subsp. palearctica Y11]CCO67097.1 hypothetical protein D322_201 [Yersinia enterocolitica IP 10393]
MSPLNMWAASLYNRLYFFALCPMLLALLPTPLQHHVNWV